MSDPIPKHKNGSTILGYIDDSGLEQVEISLKIVVLLVFLLTSHTLPSSQKTTTR